MFPVCLFLLGGSGQLTLVIRDDVVFLIFLYQASDVRRSLIELQSTDLG